MTKELDLRLLDQRVVERFLKEGRLDPKTYQTFLKSLPNSENELEYITLHEDPPSKALKGPLTFTA